MVAPLLVDIFNASLKDGEVPVDWRRANVTPIYKKGAKSDPGNFRPVSLTSVCCKLMERLVKDKLIEHFLDNNLILPSQHGFLPSKSCATNLLEFFEVATQAVDNGDPFDIVFLDFAKAFDKVPVAALLVKLEALGVSGELLRWIETWLKDRVQRVVLNGEASSWEAVLSGMPQGSILGPVLFIVHINDIDLVLKMITLLRKFADDTKLGQVVGTVEQVQRLQQALDALITWADQWGMEFNIKKCKVMHMGHNNPKNNYNMKGQVLESTKEEKDIGVMISEDLRPSAQVAKAAKTAAAILSQLTRAFHYRDRHVFVRLYKQYVLPHLEFSSVVWSPWTAADRATLEKVQIRMIKMVTGLKGQTYEERLAELGMFSLEERRHQADMIQVYKIVHGHDHVDGSHWFRHVSGDIHMTRSAGDSLNLVQSRSRLDLRRNFFSQRVVDLWNRVPPSIKRAPNTASFKINYRTFRRNMVLDV